MTPSLIGCSPCRRRIPVAFSGFFLNFTFSSEAMCVVMILVEFVVDFVDMHVGKIEGLQQFLWQAHCQNVKKSKQTSKNKFKKKNFFPAHPELIGDDARHSYPTGTSPLPLTSPVALQRAHVSSWRHMVLSIITRFCFFQKTSGMFKSFPSILRH